MNYDIVIVGAGIVGLSVIHNLLQQKDDLKITVLEKESTITLYQTGKNRGVIHSGIYYKPDILKAINCRQVYHKLIAFCKTHDIDFDICGKVIVATSKKEIPRLKKIYNLGMKNGLTGITFLDKDQIKEKEPFVTGEKAIWVPQAGNVDYKKAANKLQEILKEKSYEILVDHEETGISQRSSIHYIHCGERTIKAAYLVNCSGLYTDKIAQMQGLKIGAKITPLKGEYYLLNKSKKYLVRNLIYPVRDSAFPFLGVHFTRRINGKIDAGPNAVLAFKREGYGKLSVDRGEFLETIFYRGFIKIAIRYLRIGMYKMYRSFSKRAFTKALQKLMLEIFSDDLIVGESGIRAQLCDDNGNLMDDFVIKEGPRSTHVLNAPSLAATGSLQIGETIANKVLKLL